MDGPTVDEEDLVSSGSTLRRLMCLWQAKRPCTRAVGSVLTVLSLVVLSSLAVCIALKLYFELPEELEQITLSSLGISIILTVLLKITLFITQRSTKHQLLQVLSEIRSQHGGGQQSEDIRRRYRKFAERIYLSYQVMTLSGVLGWITTPLLSRALQGPDAQDVPRQLPFPMWLPLDVHVTPNYEILYVIQIYCVIVPAESMVSIDSFFIELVLIIAAELEILSYSVASMGKDNANTAEFMGKGGGFTHISSKEKEADGKTKGENLYLRMVQNLRHHMSVLRCVSLLQTLMNVSVFTIMLLNTATLCSSTFVAAVLLQRDGNVGKAMNALTAIGPFFYQTMMYCTFSQVMTDQSEKLLYAAFSCGWTDCDVRFKRSILIFMAITVRPIVITVGKTCTLSKQLLLQVLNRTYALLNLLFYLDLD